ncbi:MAG: hypothetical protein R2991_15655 [Thermoanaerobaculia bacterium]
MPADLAPRVAPPPETFAAATPASTSARRRVGWCASTAASPPWPRPSASRPASTPWPSGGCSHDEPIQLPAALAAHTLAVLLHR